MGSYSDQGPFTNGVTAVTAALFTAINNWILTMQDANINAAGSGRLNMLKVGLTTGTVKRIARSTGSNTQTITHNWGEQADIVIPYYNGAFGTAPTQVLAVKNEGTNSFDVVGQTGYSWTVCYIKF